MRNHKASRAEQKLRPFCFDRSGLEPSTPITAAAQKLDQTLVAQHLQLLTHLLSDMPISRIQLSQPRFEGIHVRQLKFGGADAFNAAHHLDQPATRSRTLLTQETNALPMLKDEVLRLKDAVAHQFILPASGISLSRMLQPIQPARLAVGANGLHSSMIAGVKNCFGTTDKFTTLLSSR